MQSKINDDGGRRLDALMQELRGQLGMSFSSKPLLTQRAPYDSLLAQQLLRSLGNPSSDEQEIVFKQTATEMAIHTLAKKISRAIDAADDIPDDAAIHTRDSAADCDAKDTATDTALRSFLSLRFSPAHVRAIRKHVSAMRIGVAHGFNAGLHELYLQFGADAIRSLIGSLTALDKALAKSIVLQLDVWLFNAEEIRKICEERERDEPRLLAPKRHRHTISHKLSHKISHSKSHKRRRLLEIALEMKRERENSKGRATAYALVECIKAPRIHTRPQKLRIAPAALLMGLLGKGRGAATCA